MITMSVKNALWSALLSMTIAATGPAAFAAENAHSHDAHQAAAVELKQGEKWASDAPLRKGMEGIRTELSRNLDRIHNNSLTPEQYVSLADAVSGHVQYMFENCKLKPAADAQLHTVLSQTLEGVEDMRSAAAARQGAVKIVKALDVYGTHFDHPGWIGLTH